jgi:hypothetical protein
MEVVFGLQHFNHPTHGLQARASRQDDPCASGEAVEPCALQGAAEATQTYSLVSELVDYLAVDDEGIVGVVDEIRPDGSIRIACGWFGRRDLVVQWNEVRRIHHRDRELVLHDALPSVAEIRSASGVYARLMARLVGWSLGSPHAPV